MSPDKLAAVIEAIARPDKDFAALTEAKIEALKDRLAILVTPAPSTGPPSSVRVPLPEVRAIGVPTSLNWNELTTFPLLLAEVRSIQREWEVHARQNRRFLVSNLDSGATDVIEPLQLGRRMPMLPASHSGSPPTASSAVLSSIGVLPYDLMRWYSPQQMQGRLAITFFDHDLVSNTVLVDVKGGPGKPPVSGGRLVVQPRPPKASLDAAGVKVQWPATIRNGQPALVQVELKLPRDKVALIEALPGAETSLATSLLMLRLDKSPVLMQVQVAVKPSQGFVATAFDVDLGGGSFAMLPAGDWLGYLIVGEAAIGPHRVSVPAP